MSEGVLYVEVMPSTKGIKGSIEKDLNGQFKTAEKSSDGFFSRFGKMAKTGALVVGGMVAAVGTLAIAGGISRALNIEDAQAKLKGLGHDTKNIQAIMTDALASVKGTAFGLDTAATVAASAVAAGIKPGKELERYLRLTADAATIAGSSMDEMGAIINKVTAKGKVGMENLNQLTERGIPIMQWLADEYGVTQEALSKMVSSGKVDAETFRKVIEENIGGAALASGDTTRGAFANMRAALSRLGLVFVGDGLEGAKTFFNEITTILDGVAKLIKPWVTGIQDKLGGLFQIEGMGDRFLSMFEGVSLSEALQTMVNKAVGWIRGDGIVMMLDGMLAMRSGITQGILQVTEAISQNLPAILLSIGDVITTALTGLIDMAPYILTVGIGLIEAIAQGITGTLPRVIESLMELVPGFVSALVFMLPQLITAAVGLVGSLVSALATMAPVLLNGAITLFLGLLDGLLAALPGLLSTILELVPTLVTAVLSLLPQLVAGAITLFQGIVQALITVVPELISLIVTMLPQIITALVSLIPALIDGAIQLFMAIVQAIPLIIPPLIESLLGLVPVLIDTVIGLIPVLIDAAIQLFLGIVTALPQIIPDLITAVLNLLPTIIETLISLGPKLLDAAVTLFVGLVSAIPIILPKLGEALGALWPKIWEVLKTLPEKALDAGKAIIQGLIDGVKSMFGSIGEAFGGVMDFIGDFFPHSPAKRGPFSGAGWAALANSGQALMDQFADGMGGASLHAQVASSVEHMVRVPDVASVANSHTGLRSGDSLVLSVGDRAFTGYVDERADGRTAARGNQVSSAIRNRRWADA